MAHSTTESLQTLQPTASPLTGSKPANLGGSNRSLATAHTGTRKRGPRAPDGAGVPLYGIANAIVDEDGIDRTPLSLFPSTGPITTDKSSKRKHEHGFTPQSSTTDLLNTLETMTMSSFVKNSTQTSRKIGGMVAGSQILGESEMGSKKGPQASLTSSKISDGSAGSMEVGGFGVESKDKTKAQADAAKKKKEKGTEKGSRESVADNLEEKADKTEEKTVKLTEEELNKTVDVLLTESDLIWMLNIPSKVCPIDTEEAERVKAANARYKEVLTAHQTSDNYVSRPSQTLSLPQKNKDVQISAPKTVDIEISVNPWDIYDANETMRTLQEEAADPFIADGDGVITQGGLEEAHESGNNSMTTFEGVSAGVAMSSAAISSMNDLLSTDLSDAGALASRIHGAVDDTQASDASTVAGGNFKPDASAAGQSDFEAAIGIGMGINEKELLASINQEALRNTLMTMERAVAENIYHSKLLSYKGYDEALTAIVDRPKTRSAQRKSLSSRGTESKEEEPEEEEVEEGELEESAVEEIEEIEDKVSKKVISAYTSKVPSLVLLWTYRCDLTKDRPVTCFVWNRQNQNILSVGYGKIDPSGPITANVGTASSAATGLVLCWSCKNPEFPERIYHLKSAVTAVDFSQSNPNLLAVGTFDGKVAIYDVRKKSEKPVVDNSDLPGKHRDPVWNIRWVEREQVIGDEQSRGETLVSISTDGRVVQWVLKKGLEFNDLMSLKRVIKQSTSAEKANESKGSAFISRQAGGLCFDFSVKDTNIYLAGTEDGNIHKCSCSYNEQYLENYFGHTGPVYRIAWSPFLSSSFLSCSADWTTKLWTQENDEAIYTFQSGKEAVNDVCWCPTNPTMFATVSNDGVIDLWDLQHNVLDPLIHHQVLDRRLSTVLFNSNSTSLLTGDNHGNVAVYRIVNVKTVLKELEDEQGSKPELESIHVETPITEQEEQVIARRDSRRASRLPAKQETAESKHRHEAGAKILNEILKSKNQTGTSR